MTRVGVFVDVENINRTGGFGMRYDILRRFACRDAADPVRLNAYVAFDEERAQSDRPYKKRVLDFYLVLRDLGYKVIEKKVKWFNERGTRYAKANVDLDLAVDALLQSEALDRVLLVTGDGDFDRVVRALQNKGCRVEVVAFRNVSLSLRREADFFMSGYLIPNLLPIDRERASPASWGEAESRVRGTCYSFKENFGFMRFLDRIGSDIWITDSRDQASPYQTAFVHISDFPPGFDPFLLPSRDFIFEFDIVHSERDEGKLQAKNVELLYQY
ncbi:NYN domain-containing protein [Myxococcota bacterium]|nr:NYN domain-containing protein [Myxococcota bacterium]